MSGLSPSDAAVAVRSFPRRFRAVLARPDDRDDPEQQVDPDELARRVGPDGTSAAEHLVAADGVLALVDRALEQGVGRQDPVLHPAVMRLGDVSFEDPRRPLVALLDQLETTAVDCAARIERVPTEDWGRQVHVADHDRAVGLLEIARDGVDVVAAHLRAAEQIIAAVK